MENKQNIKIKQGSNRSFGIVFSIFFSVLAIYSYFNYKEYFTILILLALLFLIFAIFFPNYLKTLNFLWFKFGMLLNTIISPIVMFLIFFCVFLPIGLIMKIIKKDLINIKKNNNLNSYWVKREDKQTNMKNQF